MGCPKNVPRKIIGTLFSIMICSNSCVIVIPLFQPQDKCGLSHRRFKEKCLIFRTFSESEIHNLPE